MSDSQIRKVITPQPTLSAENQLALAFAHYKAGHAQEAAGLLEDLATAGNADAQYLLAETYWHLAERGMSTSSAVREKAETWAQRAAEQQHPGGLLLYGVILLDQCDPPRQRIADASESIRRAALLDLPEAQVELVWLRLMYGPLTAETEQFAQRAAENGGVLGQVTAGIFEWFQALRSGGRGAENLRRAARYFRAAAEQGLVDAQTLYAGMLSEGIGVDQDDLEALKWLRIARILGWGESDSSEEELTARLTPNDLEEAQRRADTWLKVALADDDRPLGSALAWCDEFRPDQRACWRAAVWEDQTCLPLDLPVTPPAGFRKTKAYDACRSAMRDYQEPCGNDRRRWVRLLSPRHASHG